MLRRTIFHQINVRDWGFQLKAFAAFLFVGILVYQVFQAGGETVKAAIGDFGAVPINVIAATLAWRASTHVQLQVRTRRAWRIMCFAFAFSSAGDVLYGLFEVVLHVQTFPSMADIGYLLFHATMLIALLNFPQTLSSRADRFKFGFDSSTILVGGGTAVWYFILRPIVVQQGTDPLATLLSITYVLGDLVLLLGIETTWRRRWSGLRAFHGFRSSRSGWPTSCSFWFRRRNAESPSAS